MLPERFSGGGAAYARCPKVMENAILGLGWIGFRDRDSKEDDFGNDDYRRYERQADGRGMLRVPQ